MNKVFRYCPNTNSLVRLDTGEIMRGTKLRNGYLRTIVGGKSYYLHRIVWELVKGTPPIEIDHIDGDRTNNSISNLREVCRKDNSRNARHHNPFGVLGVQRTDNGKRYKVSITVDYRRIHLGVVDSLEDAQRLRKEAEVKYGFHENHGVRT